MPIAALLPLLVSILGEAPQVIDSVKNIWSLATATTAPTPEEQVTYDTALDAAHNALQASEGGVEVPVVSFGGPPGDDLGASPTFGVRSWGDKYSLLPGFDPNIDEAYGVIDPYFVKDDGKTPWNLDLAAWEALMQAIREQV